MCESCGCGSTAGAGESANPFDFVGKVAIITGGSMGIGAGCARVFAGAGAKVVICARRTEAGEALAAELTAKGPGECVFVQCDVSKAGDIERLIDAAVERFGRLDCLINNAGYHPAMKRIDDFTLEEWDDVIRVNLTSQFIACKAALPHLRKTCGSIINMGSLVGIMGQEGASTYCATKGGIVGFTKALAVEEAENGVRVNVVLPGNIVTEGRINFVASREDGEEIDRWADSNQVMGRSGTVEETGNVCLFLASGGASFLTGIEMLVSGGAELDYGVKHPRRFFGK